MSPPHSEQPAGGGLVQRAEPKAVSARQASKLERSGFSTKAKQELNKLREIR